MATSAQIIRSHAPRSAFKRLIEETGAVDQVGIEERVAKFATRSIKKKSKVWGLTTAVSMVDLTTLEGKDTPGKVRSLCQKARHGMPGRTGSIWSVVSGRSLDAT